jgi:ribosomal protein S18 acetylase RimI-like enzyme
MALDITAGNASTGRWARGLMRRVERYAGAQAYRLMARPLDGGARRACPPGVALRPMACEELLAHCACGDLGLRRDAVRAACARGEVCVGALHGNALVAYVWFALRAAPHLGGTWAEFDPRAVYLYRAFVRPAWRGRGIAPALYTHEDQRFLRAGREHALVCVAAHNHASLAAARAAGFRGHGHVFTLQCGQRLFLARTRGAADLSFRFRA